MAHGLEGAGDPRAVRDATGTPSVSSSPMRSAGTSLARRTTLGTTAREVVALFEKLVAVTKGTFQLEPQAFLNSVEHSAVLVRWWAEREGSRSEGNEIAVYRFRDGKIAQVWFYVDGYEPEAFSRVFGFD